jgi:methylglutaconyl-CoA hydratase
LLFQLLFAANDQQQLDQAADLLATVRVSEEGQEGLRAFLEKRKPNWTRG